MFRDANQAYVLANALQRAVKLCGGTVQNWQDPKLQARIDKTLKKAGKPHVDWGSVFSAAAAGMAAVNDGMSQNTIQNAADQQTANIQAAQARAAAAEAQQNQPSSGDTTANNPDCPTAAELAANPKLACRAR